MYLVPFLPTSWASDGGITGFSSTDHLSKLTTKSD
jgi:hypothetical protein